MLHVFHNHMEKLLAGLDSEKLRVLLNFAVSAMDDVEPIVKVCTNVATGRGTDICEDSSILAFDSNKVKKETVGLRFFSTDYFGEDDEIFNFDFTLVTLFGNDGSLDMCEAFLKALRYLYEEDELLAEVTAKDIKVVIQYLSIFILNAVVKCVYPLTITKSTASEAVIAEAKPVIELYKYLNSARLGIVDIFDDSELAFWLETHAGEDEFDLAIASESFDDLLANPEFVADVTAFIGHFEFVLYECSQYLDMNYITKSILGIEGYTHDVAGNKLIIAYFENLSNEARVEFMKSLVTTSVEGYKYIAGVYLQ